LRFHLRIRRPAKPAMAQTRDVVVVDVIFDAVLEPWPTTILSVIACAARCPL